MQKTYSELQLQMQNNTFDAFKTQQEVSNTHKSKSGIDTDFSALDLTIFNNYHLFAGYSHFAGGKWGEKGEHRFGILPRATLAEIDSNYSDYLGAAWVLESKLRLLDAAAIVNIGEDGATLDIYIDSFSADIVFGQSDPNCHHDAQGSIGVAGPGLGFPVPPFVPIPTELHWCDADQDGYREFGGTFYVDVLSFHGIVLLSIVIDFKFEIGVSDNDFQNFANDVKKTFVKFGFQAEDSYKKLEGDIEKFGNNVKDELQIFGDGATDIFVGLNRNMRTEFDELMRDTNDIFDMFGSEPHRAFEEFERDAKDCLADLGRDFSDAGRKIGDAFRHTFHF